MPEPGTPAGAPPSRLRSLQPGGFSVADSIGGVRGVLESVVPFAVFSLVYGVGGDMRTAVVAALVPAAVLAGWRLVAREPLTQAVGGLVGIAIGAFLASRSGRAEDIFLPTLLKNAGFTALYAVSVLVRWPVVGLLLGVLTEEGTAWRRDPVRLRAYSRVTWLWAGLFAVRLGVQLPLYLSGEVVLLGTLNSLVLGLPLFVLTLWLSWLLLRGVPGALPDVRSGRAAGRHAGPDPVEEAEVRPPAAGSGASAAPPRSPAP